MQQKDRRGEKIRLKLIGNKMSEKSKSKMRKAHLGKKTRPWTDAEKEAFRQARYRTVERLLAEIPALEKLGYRCIPVGHRTTPDIIAIKGKDIEVTGVEVEYGKPNYAKYAKNAKDYYDDILWILRGTTLPKAVIFEGPDGCGKTHIAKAFVKRHVEFNYFKLKKDKVYVKDVSPDILKLGHELEAEFFISFVRQVKFNAAFDRNYPSEICYGRAFRAIDEKYWRIVDLEHSKIGTKIILCIKNAKRKDTLFTRKQVEKVQKEYMRFAKETKCKILVLDTTDENLKEQLKKIDNFVYGFSHTTK